MRSSVVHGHSARFNPFNNDDLSISSELDDDTLAPSSGSEITSIGSDGSGDISLAELGLTEDYFAHPEGLFGISTAEELEGAIENCKTMIIEARQGSDRYKKLVNKLIQLRMKLQDLKEGPSEVEPKVRQVLGHKLRKKKSNSVKHYCDCCNGLIWGMLQAWYRCKECGFNCHYKCVNMVRRKCIAGELQNMSYVLNICPENGLSAQKFICFECKNPILVVGDGKEEARLCDYSGQYYCPQCHWNDMSVIPARVIRNWDFTPCKVSRQSFLILSKLYQRPLLNIQDINPSLFNFVDELQGIRKFREDILKMKEYFVTCNNALDMKLLLKLQDRQHFVDSADMYSMEDLVQAQDTTLLDRIAHLHADYAKHIKFDCPYCQGKGFMCEICNDGEVLFPFDTGVSSCSKCKAVFHQDCFTFSDCPRCERMRKKRELVSTPADTSEAQNEDSDQEISSYLRDTAMLERASLPGQSNFPAAFSNEPTMFAEKLTERPKSLRISDNNFDRSRHDSSLQSLTESSYTDYANLGFIGAGKGQSSPQDDSHNTNLPSDVTSFTPTYPYARKLGPRSISKPSTPSDPDRGAVGRKPNATTPSDQKWGQRSNFQPSKVTESPMQVSPNDNSINNTHSDFMDDRTKVQRSDNFGDLDFGIENAIEGYNPADAKKKYHFDRTIRIESKYADGLNTGRQQRDQASFNDLIKTNGHSKTKNGRKDKHHGNSSRHQKIHSDRSKLKGYDLEDPFNQNANKGSEFIRDAKKVTERSSEGQSGNGYSANRDPFSGNVGSKVTGKSSKSSQRIMTYEPYDPALDPFGNQQNNSVKFIQSASDKQSTKSRGRHPQKLPKKAASKEHRPNNPNLSPFSLNDPSRSYDIPSRSMYNPDLDPFNDNSLGIHAKNPFEDDYDVTMNPFY